ncbi:hypothetical protein ACFOOK_22710 [Micromonospora krabiensis]|uniref:Uncharacterized protein n=1 Tax=Micromonospora krabiensis TaxID=307121 RepID=A0A1C3N7T5_9ACTN|nr:hypothetical protein [Micromonospora krabiensis]SBV28621.1 hypothetical protein GA0070620_4168 [Micromonospora krabiensis]
MTTDDGEPEEPTGRPSLRVVARDRRVWAILGIVAAVLVCCCSVAVGLTISWAGGLLGAG